MFYIKANLGDENSEDKLTNKPKNSLRNTPSEKHNQLKKRAIF